MFIWVEIKSLLAWRRGIIGHILGDTLVLLSKGAIYVRFLNISLKILVFISLYLIPMIFGKSYLWILCWNFLVRNKVWTLCLS